MEFRVVRETRVVPVMPWRTLFIHVSRGERAPATTSIALVLTTPGRIATWNQHYHHKHGPTDVLAFPSSTGGDIVICPAILKQRHPGMPLPALLAHRFVHALLHLNGYRHATDAAARRMEARTRHYLALVHRPWLRSLPEA